MSDRRKRKEHKGWPPGQRRLPKGQQARSKRLIVRLQPRELAIVERAARSLRLGRSDWVRRALLWAAGYDQDDNREETRE